MEIYEIIVRGRVQGVGFRYYTEKQAETFGLTGWVKNLANGSVQVMVQGEKAEIDTFVDFLRVGPTLSRVSDVSVSRVETNENFNEFRIKY